MPSKQFKEDSAILRAHRKTWEPDTKAEGEAFLAKYTPTEIAAALHRVEHYDDGKRGPKKGSKKAPKKGGRKTRRRHRRHRSTRHKADLLKFTNLSSTLY